MKVGFVGMGRMGQGMAQNVLKAADEVIVYNRTPEKAKPLEEKGAKVAKSVSELKDCDVVITMLADDPAQDAVMFGETNLGENIGKGKIHIASGTISQAEADKLEQYHKDNGQIFIAAPVLGRPDVAEAGDLVLLIAGPEKEIKTCWPLFEAMGGKLYQLGEKPSQASVVKLCMNFMLAVCVETMAEATTLMRKAGVDADQFCDLYTNTVFAAPAYKVYGPLIAKGEYRPAKFTASLGLKDIGLAIEAAEALGVPLPVANAPRDGLLSAVANGDADADWSVLGEVSDKRAGIKKK